jgi:tRNA-splicing ligase RtcB
MNHEPGTRVHRWLSAPVDADVERSLERLSTADDVAHVAVMPDVHLAAEVCVGVAVATRRLIYPAAVGSDIGCGMAAVGFDGPADVLVEETAAGRVLAGLYRRVPALRHPAATMPPALPVELQDTQLSHPALEQLKRRDGRVQLGTLGRGNHFLEFQSDAAGRLWLMVHSGSRGMGQAITGHHVGLGDDESTGGRLLALEADSPVGAAYLVDAAWAERYAEQNRLAMIRAVGELVNDLFGFALDESTLIHGNHNHVRQETHFGDTWWVHRKGALPAGDGVPGVIPGSMGSPSYHVEGRGCPESLASSSHGAGRAKSRTEAARSIGVKQLSREMAGVWFDHRRSKQLCDEAPSAYKDIRAVMRAQRELTKIVRELHPVLSYKG